jgi:uncharacterized membrane protein YeiB
LFPLTEAGPAEWVRRECFAFPLTESGPAEWVRRKCSAGSVLFTRIESGPAEWVRRECSADSATDKELAEPARIATSEECPSTDAGTGGA